MSPDVPPLEPDVLPAPVPPVVPPEPVSPLVVEPPYVDTAPVSEGLVVVVVVLPMPLSVLDGVAVELVVA